MGLSSNILWHQTTFEGILKILESKHLCYAYSREIIPGTDKKAAFPMISLCDLPFSEMADYLGKYGDYTIGFDRKWGKEHNFNSVWYCENGSRVEKMINDEIAGGNYGTAAYVKPVEGELETKEYLYKNYRYFDEREVRIVATEEEVQAVRKEWRLSEEEYAAYKDANGNSLLDPKQLFIEFSANDIKYIILRRETQVSSFKKRLIKWGYGDNSIGIFSQNRIRQDFIGIAHNIRRERPAPEIIEEANKTMELLKESQKELKETIINLAMSDKI